MCMLSPEDRIAVQAGRMEVMQLVEVMQGFNVALLAATLAAKVQVKMLQGLEERVSYLETWKKLLEGELR